MKKMKTKSIGILSIVGLVVLSAMVVFAGTAVAEGEDPVKFKGNITYPDGSGVEGANVKIEKVVSGSVVKSWEAVTNDAGYYETSYKILVSRAGHYQMMINDNVVEEKDLVLDDFYMEDTVLWSYTWNYEIPEFPPPAAVPTLTPIGIIALVGLLSAVAAMSISIRKKR